MAGERSECLEHSAMWARQQRTETDVATLARSSSELAQTVQAHNVRIDTIESTIVVQGADIKQTSLTIERWRGIGLSGVAIAGLIGAIVSGIVQIVTALLGRG